MFLTVSVTDMAIYGLLVLVGLAVCFFGYQIFRAWLFIAGLQVGFFIGLWLGGMVFKSQLVTLIGAILLGIAMAFLMGLVIRVGGFLAGAGVLFLVALLIVRLFGISSGARLIILLCAAILGGVLGALSVKAFLVLATAANGAYLVSVSLWSLIVGRLAGETLIIPGQIKTIELILLLAATVVLAILGSLVQFRLISRKKTPVVIEKGAEPTMQTASSEAGPALGDAAEDEKKQ